MKRLVLTWLFVLSGGVILAQTPKVYVFLPSNIRPHVMKQRLSMHCPQIEFTVFGRFREFQARIQDSPPDAILSLEPVISRHENARPVLRGRSGGKSSETYVLLSRDNPVAIDQIGGQVIGVVDLLGRSQMNEFLTSKLNVSGFKRIRTVTKLEDLLSLLQFRDADAILVPESKIPYYRNRTRLTLEVTRLDNVTIGLPVVAALNTETETLKTITESLQSAAKDLEDTLGVEQWVRP